MNKHNLSEFSQAQIAKEMNARLLDIKSSRPDDHARQLGKVEGMLTIWLMRMGELNEK